MVYIYTDGASRGNGGKSAAAFIITNGATEIARSARYLGNATNNIAEYMAVYDALEYCLNNNICRKGTVTTIISDSQLIINQLKGAWKKYTVSLQIEMRRRAMLEAKGVIYEHGVCKWVALRSKGALVRALHGVCDAHTRHGQVCLLASCVSP